MGDVRDTFAGADGALAAADTGQAPQLLLGSATRRSGRGVALQANTLVAYDAGAGGNDAKLHLDLDNSAGGHALFGRVVDADDHWTLNVRQYAYSYSIGSATIYTWGQTYQSDQGIITGQPAQTATISTYSSSAPYFSPTYNGLPQYGGPYLISTQNSEQYANATAWEVRLQRVIAGARQTMRQLTRSTRPTALDLDLSGNSLLASVTDPNGTTALQVVTDPAHATATMHGWGSSPDAGNSQPGVDNFAVRPYNTPPSPPRLVYPRGAEPVDRTGRTRLTLEARDPDSGDTISRTDWRWRLKDSGAAWTVTEQRLPLAYLDVAGGTWTLGVWEYQAKTYDRVGAASDWSASEFLTAADPVPGPTWLDPVNGQTIGQDPYTVDWATDDQTAYQVQTTPDVDGGVWEAGYFDSGQVESTSARSLAVRFRTNGRRERVRIRVRGANGLWSGWVYARLVVGYTPPLPALLSLVPDLDTAAIVVTIVDPTPPAGTPAAQSHDVYVRPKPTATTPPSDGVRVATNLLPSSSYRYRFPTSDQELEVLVTTSAANGTRDPGAWTDRSTTALPGAGGNLYGAALFDAATYG